MVLFYVFGTAVAAVGCAASGAAAPSETPADAGRLLNPRADGQPVMLSYDSHHPDCFTFPSEGKESEKVACPKGALGLLSDCRGSRLYTKKSGGGCLCVPVSDEPAVDVDCPDAIETE